MDFRILKSRNCNLSPNHIVCIIFFSLITGKVSDFPWFWYVYFKHTVWCLTPLCYHNGGELSHERNTRVHLWLQLATCRTQTGTVLLKVSLRRNFQDRRRDLAGKYRIRTTVYEGARKWITEAPHITPYRLYAQYLASGETYCNFV